MRIRLRVESITFSKMGTYLTLVEPFKDNPEALDCTVKVFISEEETQGWILLMGREVCFERVPTLLPTGHPPLQEPDPRDGKD